MRHIAFPVLIGALFLPTLIAQPCLVGGDPQRVGALETFAGAVQPKLVSVEPSGRVAIAVFPGLISADRQERMSAALTAIYKTAGKTRPLTLAVFNGEGFSASGPFETAKAWSKAVREAVGASDHPEPPLPAARLYSIVSAPAAGFVGDWSSVILAGPLPEPPPTLAITRSRGSHRGFARRSCA